ncbi:MAG: FkbM family methyltransferase [Holosporaceae bacterium]|jgi:FkbM family methyltransferase|nr:FkbM family methyltransferase [Holosporaceae bacterium]
MKFYKLIKNQIVKEDNSNYRKYYYSQDGEDVLIKAFYDGQCGGRGGGGTYKGFYVDIGAHHPLRFSNTQIFYENGWRGINIDATPGSMEEFRKLRPFDINIEAGISDCYGEMEYFSFEESALNSFCKEISDERINNGWKLKETVKIKTYPINDILGKHLPKNQRIDFISMDIEGLELAVLGTFDFERFAPKYFLIEELNFVENDFMSYHEFPVYQLMRQKGYIVVAKTMRTVIFSLA